MGGPQRHKRSCRGSPRGGYILERGRPRCAFALAVPHRLVLGGDTRALWPFDDLLQPVRPLAQGRGVGSATRYGIRRLRRSNCNDRLHLCPRPPAWCVGQQGGAGGTFPRWTDDQDPYAPRDSRAIRWKMFRGIRKLIAARGRWICPNSLIGESRPPSLCALCTDQSALLYARGLVMTICSIMLAWAAGLIEVKCRVRGALWSREFVRHRASLPTGLGPSPVGRLALRVNLARELGRRWARLCQLLPPDGFTARK